MSDTEILSPTSENGDTNITKKRMSERDADSSDESSSYDDKIESSQNGMNGKEMHSNGKEVEDDSEEEEGSHGFRMDGEPDYKPRKVWRMNQILKLKIITIHIITYFLIGMRIASTRNIISNNAI